MKIGIPREVKDSEYRVAITPAGVRELVALGHDISIEADAGLGSSIPDAEYKAAGARIINGADDLWSDADLVCKVKEPVEEEFHRLRPRLVLFTYLHLAASRACTEALLSSKTTAIAYETIQLPDGSLPLLAPMSEIAGRMAPLAGAQHLTRHCGGRGVLMCGVPGVNPARVVVIGAGVAGANAAAMAVGMHADVVVLDRDVARLRSLDTTHAGRLRTVAANAQTIEEACVWADLVIGAVLVPGARAPRLVSDQLVSQMRPGSVLVDISVDQGGCLQSSRPTTHTEPTFQVHETLFYCVANMPGAVPHTSTYALANATLPYMVKIAERGWRQAARCDRSLALGINAVDGMLTSAPVAEAHGLPVMDADEFITGD
jgi:alanine dehydrogenase